MAFCFHWGSELSKVESNQVVNLALRLCPLVFGPSSSCCGLVALKLPILVVHNNLPMSWDLVNFLGLGRYSMGPKALSGMLGWPSHLSSLHTIWAFRVQSNPPSGLGICWQSSLPWKGSLEQHTVKNASDLLVVPIQESPHKIIETGLLALEDSEWL